MATFMKPTSKLFELPSHASAELNLTDLMCPVCRGILIEPVTLPCAHSLCLRCLNGTVQHNSLSCPLCRVRVGSWLRTATKSDTLVNSGLWKLIKTRFSKEIQAKHAGEESQLDSGFVTTDKILSAAGEIRREYEAQRQIVEKEMRQQREAERKASEALIRKIHEEERQQLNPLNQDHLMAASLAKKDKAKGKLGNVTRLKLVDSFYSGDQLAPDPKIGVREPNAEAPAHDSSDADRLGLIKSKDGTEWKSNIALISKIRAERYASSMKSNVPTAYKTTSETLCCQNPYLPQNSTGRPMKHEIITKIHLPTTSDYLTQPSCSSSRIYGTQSTEELHVPSDVLNRKKKSLGVEVCLTANAAGERIGSAESNGSHDSINIEIHHFKPIKAMPRTPLKSSIDGRQVDPKLIRVVAIFKRVSNPVLKPPLPMPLKRLSGCSYSAFKGKSKRAFLEMQSLSSAIESSEKKPSTSQMKSSYSTGKMTKPQVTDTARRLDLSSEVYAKNVNRLVNGTRVSKKLILEDQMDATTKSKAAENSAALKSKRRKNSSDSDEDATAEDQDSVDGSSSRNRSSSDAKPSTVHRPVSASADHVPPVENIAERIKKRKMHHPSSSDDSSKGDSLRKPLKQRRTTTLKKSEARVTITKSPRKATVKSKSQRRTKARKFSERENDSSENSDWAVENIASKYEIGRKTRTSNRQLVKEEVAYRRSTRNAARDDSANNNNGKSRSLTTSEPNSKDGSDPNETEESDEEIVEDQKRMERLVLQEKEDFELAQRLQAQFNEMERISGRTRNSRRGRDSDRGMVVKSGERSAKSNDLNKRRRTQRRLVK